ncbi:thioredoxin 1 [Nonomuraea maritima]|uniref:Thioredoxin n=2 Tax=Nonomuraea maritima TaxID=683260 RepID=A0A1G8S2W8_9ACTN|nr:thioredoxin 1 [Nonomuraea maritima]
MRSRRAVDTDVRGWPANGGGEEAMAGTLKSVTDESFEADVLGKDGIVVVDFWAKWCGPCRQMAPELEKLQAAYATRIDVLKLDIEENPRMAERYGVTSIPMLNVYRDGEVVKTIIGAASMESVAAELAEFLD